MDENLFNNPLEFGLRILYILKNTKKKLSLQRLIYYNYLLIHSSDIEEAPKSLHPNMPNRSCELIISREILKKALILLMSRELIKVHYLKTGIYYGSNKYTSLFLNHFNTEYSQRLDNVSKWIIERFDSLSEKDIANFMNNKIKDWGSEFIGES